MVVVVTTAKAVARVAATATAVATNHLQIYKGAAQRFFVGGSFFCAYNMTIVDIVDAVTNPDTVWRTLRGVEPLYHNGRPIYVTGNAAVTFTVRHEGGRKMLKCYTRKNPHLKEIYGERFYPRELCAVTVLGDKLWVDCLLYDRIEGRTLDEEIEHTASLDDFRALAAAFDNMAFNLLAGDMTHGDLKPENIIVGEDGQFSLIDFDAAFLPSMAGESAPEIGTAAYQHPTRDTNFFDNHIDDYSIAMLSTTLHAAALNRTVAEALCQTHEPPFSPRDIVEHKSALFDEVVELFAQRGLAREYRVARMLCSPSPRLFNLRSTLSFATQCPITDDLADATLEQEEGLWGCRNDKGWIVPPLYDGGFEPMGEVIILTLGGYTHLVSLRSCKVIRSFDKQVEVKPAKSHRVIVTKADSTHEVLELETLLQNSTK